MVLEEFTIFTSRTSSGTPQAKIWTTEPIVFVLQGREEPAYSNLPMNDFFTWLQEYSRTLSNLKSQIDSFSAAIERDLVRMLSQISEVERILIRKDLDYMRIWTVLRDTDVDVEDRIYDAQLAFMDKFLDIPCDFSVIFRQDLDPNAINPLKAQVLFRR